MQIQKIQSIIDLLQSPKSLGTLLIFVCCSTSAQYRCLDSKGSVSFQQTPCAAGEKEQKVKIFNSESDKPKPLPPQPANAALNADQRMLATIQRERRLEDKDRRIQDLEQQIDYIQNILDRRNSQMSLEIAGLQHKKTYAKNNLAGANWEQSISTEMQAVTQKYKTMNDVDFERLRQVRTELDVAKAAK